MSETDLDRRMRAVPRETLPGWRGRPVDVLFAINGRIIDHPWKQSLKVMVKRGSAWMREREAA